MTERDFHIAAQRRLQAGATAFVVRNSGPDQHELILVRGRARTLPMRSDGITVDEKALGKRVVASLEPGPPAAEHNLNVDLRPGRYVMFCNMYGHYEAGMHTELRVQ